MHCGKHEIILICLKGTVRMIWRHLVVWLVRERFSKHVKQEVQHVCCHLVGGAVGAALLHLHQDEGVQEVGGDHVGDKRRGLFLEHQRHDVIPYVAFPLELKENVVVTLSSCHMLRCYCCHATFISCHVLSCYVLLNATYVIL